MNNAELIEELTKICVQQAEIIKKQAETIGQLEALNNESDIRQMERETE